MINLDRVLLLWLLPVLRVRAAPRPNILFLMADEMDGRILDPDSPQVKPPMPNLNALAAAGAKFTTAYNQAPQCVPSRAAMMVGLRTDQVGVYDNWLGGVATNGSADAPDPYCVDQFGKQACIQQAKRQAAPPTFIDRLADVGYGINLYGKMHTGWGLDRYNGSIQEHPFSTGKGSTKAQREWTRGLGPTTNTKGCKQYPSFGRPPNKTMPALSADYDAMNSCVDILRAGLFNDPSTPQFLYCSIIVPHPPYASNFTYLNAVANLTVGVPALVPLNESHPNDIATSTLKHMLDTDQYSADDVEYFRRVYFSMCYESDTMLGEIINALDQSGARDNTYVIMISDHGEDNIEHRQTGKNNMYDSASRVAMVLSGPGVATNQVIRSLTSLNDVYPTILDMARITDVPSNLAGGSLLQLVNTMDSHGAMSPGNASDRRDYVIAQYHSVYSVTGEFMIRQGDFKLIMYAANKYRYRTEHTALVGRAEYPAQFPSQLFNLRDDPWELKDISASNPDVVKRLETLLRAEVDVEAADAAAKDVARDLFLNYVWGDSEDCQSVFEKIYGVGVLNSSDAEAIADWSGRPCKFAGVTPDPTCEHGIKDSTGTICCAASCGVCAHPSEKCSKRPGGSAKCCPSVVQKQGISCEKRGAPCVISS